MRLKALIFIFFLLAGTAEAQLKAFPKEEKPRIVLLTDIGGDRDDEQSFTRFMMYANQFDIEGLIATSIRIFPKEKHRPLNGAPQPQYLLNFLKAYAQVRDNLLKHSEGWPDAEHLMTLIRTGTITMRDAPFNIHTGIASEKSTHYPLEKLIGNGKDTGGSQLIIEAVDRDDPRPVWIPIWGGSVELAQALWRVRNDRSEKELQKFVSKIRAYAWGHQDASGLWIQKNFPDLFYLVSTGGILFAADPYLQSKEWLDEHVRFKHGPFGALCPIRWGKFGGADCETYLGLIQNGLSNMEHPDWGGWGGQLQRQVGYKNRWEDLPSNLDPNNLGNTISRWAPEFQNDLQARLDWCVKDFDEANHPPSPVLNKSTSLKAIEINANVGELISLDATGSFDIDEDQLSYLWKFYPEVSSFKGEVKLQNANKMVASLTIPLDAKGQTFHVLLVLSDDGEPQLTRYRRLIINCI